MTLILPLRTAEARDEEWRQRPSFDEPSGSGAESLIAGTASSRIRIAGLDFGWVT